MKLRKSGSGAFIIGAGSVLDIGARGPIVVPPVRARAASTLEALQSDAIRVGRDLARAFERVRGSSAA